MNSNDKSLLKANQLKAKLAELKKNRKLAEISELRQQISADIDGFRWKYRFADEAESNRLQQFTNRLEFSSPAHIVPSPADTAEHRNMYLCFLCGSEALMEIYIYGSYADILQDIADWSFFSPYLLLVDSDFVRYVLIDDNGRLQECSTAQ